jgi:RNA recognition motif-containing protein
MTSSTSAISTLLLLVFATSAEAFVARPAASRLSRLSFGVSVANTAPRQPLFVASEIDSSAESPVVDEGINNEEKEAPKRVVERVRHTLFVGNLPFETTDDEVRDMLTPFGKVELVSIPRNKMTGQPRGFAFVDMGSPEEMEAAVAGLDNQQVNGRMLRVNKSLPKEDVPKKERREQDGAQKLYVGNIPFEATKEALMEFYRAYGEVIEVYIPLDAATGNGRGFAFVTMKEEDAQAAIDATNGMEYEGRKMVVSVPLPPGKKAAGKRGPRNADRTKMYIGNLSFYTVPETLQELFEEFGTVIDCYMPEDPETGSARGFGFVTMDKEAAQRAIEEIDGCELDGRIIRVNEAQPKGSRPARREQDDYDNDGDDFSDEYSN